MIVSKKKSGRESKGIPAPVVSEEEPRRKTRQVDPAELLPPTSYHRPLTPSMEGNGARWTMRHPDLDGNSFTGKLAVRGIVGCVLDAVNGFITTSVRAQREALERMGWVLWRTENDGYHPVRTEA